jgi:hypothetical protein
VCKSWRQLALETPSHWSHIDLLIDSEHITNDFKSRATLWFSRCRWEVDRHFHIQAGPRFRRGFARDTIDLDRIVKWISLEIFKISSWGLELGKAALHHLCHGFSLYAGLSGSSLRSLTLNESRPDDEADDLEPVQLGGLHTESIPWYSQRLQQIRSLSVSNQKLRWVNPYPNLIKLDISACRPAVTAAEMLDVLSASPDLRILRLSQTSISQTPAASSLPPAYSRSLEVLDLMGMDSISLKNLLPLISPGTNALDTGFTLAHNLDGTLDALQPFLGRSLVVRLLSQGGPGWHQKLPFLFGHLPHLQHLCVEELSSLLDECNSLNFMTSESNASGPWPLSICPELRTLKLSDCLWSCSSAYCPRVLSGSCV